MTKFTVLVMKCAAGAAIAGLVAVAPVLAGAAAGAQQAATTAAGGFVPVVPCASTYVGAPLSGPKEPRTEKTTLSSEVASKLAFYTDQKRTLPPVLGPRGWSCEVVIATDGTVSVNIYPGGTKPQPSSTGRPGIVARSDSLCQGCVYDTVCPFDPGAATALGYSGLPCSPLAKGEVVTWEQGSPKDNKSPVHDVIGFVVPGHQASDGVVLFDLTKSGSMASEDECTLPSAERPLCVAVLASFAQENWLMP
jgi:hypothetical protein